MVDVAHAVQVHESNLVGFGYLDYLLVKFDGDSAQLYVPANSFLFLVLLIFLNNSQHT